jgi:hypothetical protein
LTPDGSRVFFTSTQQLVNGDTDETKDIYACDIPSGNPAPTSDKANHCAAFRQVSGAQSGAAVESVNRTSENGATVLFTATGVLTDHKSALGEKALAGDHNLYAWRTDAAHPDGQTTFVGRLDGDDVNDAQATPDGRYLAFTTTTQLLETDTDNARDIYRYDADTGQLTRASTNVLGVAGNGDGFDTYIDSYRLEPEHNPTTVISDDGQRIVFTTAEALSAADGNEESDVYLWTPARVSLISTGSSGFAPRDRAGNINSPYAYITGSGQDIYFGSSQQLTPADGDDSADIYDARVGGGFSFAQATSCSGEACQPGAPDPPVFKPLGSQGASPGNPPLSKSCPKGKIRKHGKCVKKPKKQHGKKHHGKKAGQKRGGGK